MMAHTFFLIRDSDFLALAFTAGLVFYVGVRASITHPTVERIAKWLSGLTFVAYVVAAIAIDGYQPIESIAGYILRGGLAAALVLGAFAFSGSFAVRTWQFIAPIPRYFKERSRAARARIEAAERRQQEAIDAARKAAQLEQQRAEALRYQQERERIQAEAAKRAALEQRRRMDARAECELCYSEHIHNVAERFSRKLVHAFMKQYMGDDQPADAVELRGQQLQRIIKDHANAVQPPKKPSSIEEVSAWFVQEKARIAELPIDDEMREYHLVQLNMRYAELTQSILEAMNP